MLSRDPSVPTATVAVYYGIGFRIEPRNRTGFAHLFEHMMFQGSKHVGDDKHFAHIQEAGGTLNGSTNADRTNYFETVPAEHLATALWLEADRMANLANSFAGISSTNGLAFTTTKAALGAVVMRVPTMTAFDSDPLDRIETGDWVRIDADNGTVSVWKGGRP